MSRERLLPLRAAFAILMLPGMVAGAIPWWIHLGGERWPLAIGDWSYLALVLGIPGFLIFASTVIEFFRRGRGTLAPWDPPRALVASGLYAWCRNPMYLGVLLMIWAQGLWWRSGEVVVYGYFMAAAFHIRVLTFEEPWLARTFPAEWEGYRAKVKRWGVF